MIQALVGARDLTNRPECDSALAAYGVPTLSALVQGFDLGYVDENDLPSGNIFDFDSLALVDYEEGGRTQHSTVRDYFSSHPNVNAVTGFGGIVFIGVHFYDQGEYDRQLTILHEAVHVAGKKDTDFGATQDAGSAFITALPRLKCPNT